MSKIPESKLMDVFVKMCTQHWAYRLGAAEEGCVDCSGAFVYAYRLFGKSIAHGSNAIARQYVEELLPISEAQPGMAAFKYREPGEKGYNLPDKYKPGGSAYNGDLRDYYHIGLVNETRSHVLNSQSTQTGFMRSKISQNWKSCGYLKAVDYGREEGVRPMNRMIVTAANGDPVRVRRSPSTASEAIARLDCGTEVMAGDDLNGWRNITFGDSAGYMMAKFLTPVQEEGTSFVRTLTPEEYNALCDARDQLKGIERLLESIVGVG